MHRDVKIHRNLLYYIHTEYTEIQSIKYCIILARTQNVKWVSHYLYSTFTYSKYFHFVFQKILHGLLTYKIFLLLIRHSLQILQICIPASYCKNEKIKSTITNHKSEKKTKYKIVFQTFYNSYNVNYYKLQNNLLECVLCI